MEFDIVKAGDDSSVQIAGLIRTVWNKMENKTWFVADSGEDIDQILSSGMGMAYLAMEKESGEAAGIFMTVFPGKSADNLGRDADIPKEELEIVAHMESAAVLPEYRGYGLQYRLMQEGEKEIARLGYRYLMCTVHPENRFSLENVQRQGYEIVKVTEKYGGYLRAVLLKRVVA